MEPITGMKLRLQGYQVGFDDEGNVTQYVATVQMIPIENIVYENSSAQIYLREGDLNNMTLTMIKQAAFDRFRALVAGAV